MHREPQPLADRPAFAPIASPSLGKWFTLLRESLQQQTATADMLKVISLDAIGVQQYHRMRPDPTDERKPEVGSIPDPMANL